MADGYDDSQIERMREQVRMSMGAMCDALSVTSVMSHGDPVAGTLDLDLESSVAMAVLGTSGSIDSNMMVTLLDGASPDITDSETLVTQLEDAIDAMGQVLDSEIAAPSAASGHPTIAADISVPLIVDDATVGAVMVFLAPKETSDQVGAEPTAEEAVKSEPIEQETPAVPSAPAPSAPAPSASAAAAPISVPKQIDALAGVQMEVTIEIGRTRLPVGELLQLQPGQVLELDREVGSPLDMYINGTLLARGEIVVLEDHFGFRVTAVVSQD
ncbi:flagellar motor switch protein FliN [Actinomycetota bacterium]|nr:flagellar motor switch protein FliN [Actinomycetota bacterium]